VDDNITNLDVAKGLMGLYGLTIDCVTGGQQAVDAIRDERVMYNAIFMDHMMPDMDGIEATRIIREEIGTVYARRIPIIALTANAIVGSREMFISEGFNAFISKPINITHLDTVLREWVRNVEAEALLPNQVINHRAADSKESRIVHEHISGLDIRKGVAHFGYSEEAYIKVLKSYVANTRPLLDKINDIDANTPEAYTVTVHGIKGSSHGIFAEKAGSAAESLEKAALAGDMNYINANNQSFIDMVRRLLNDIEKVIKKNEKEKKPEKDKPDPEILARLRDACDSFDIDEIDAAIDALESYIYTADDGLTARLRENIDKGKYKKIKDELSRSSEAEQ
jgi:CheY-like chemotaxis protein